MRIVDQIEELMRNVANDLKGRWDFYQHRAYLKKMGWTEEAYKKQTDILCNKRADRISYFYHGYNHIHVFESTRQSPFVDYDTWLDAYAGINEWCTKNCQGRWREDIHRVVKQTGLKQVGDSTEWIEEPEWFINEIGGGDALFYAFEDSKDYMLFCLRWA
jgi:hypothetical protein